MTTLNYNEVLKCIRVEDCGNFVFKVILNRPQKRNALSAELWKEIGIVFRMINEDPNCRCIILSGAGKSFCAGVDFSQMLTISGEEAFGREDPPRKAHRARKAVQTNQESFSAIEECKVPVIATIHHACYGGALGIITACDIRYASSDAFFSVKEVDIGLIEDVGTLQRMPKSTGNESLIRELAYTSRMFSVSEAEKLGLVSKVFDSREAMAEGAMNLAVEIASRSPVAVNHTKLILNYSRDHGVPEALNYSKYVSSMVFTGDDMKAAALQNAQRRRERPIFSKL